VLNVDSGAVLLLITKEWDQQTHQADIPQGGSDFGEYSAVKPLIAFAEELE
jgi:hypothetical protein